MQTIPDWLGLDLSTGFEPSSEDLQTISSLAGSQRALAHRVEQLESALSEAKNELRDIQERQLPEAMLACGVREFKLVDGSRITIKKLYFAKIPDEAGSEAFQWLTNEGHGDVIKNIVSISFGREQDEMATSVARALADQGLPVKQAKSVHPQTLKALVKELIESGKDLPLATFGVHIINRAEIKEN